MKINLIINLMTINSDNIICKVPFSEFIRMKSDLSHYFENNENIVEFINKFKERRFTKYYLTFLFYLEYSEISKITNIDDILNNFENSLDLSFSYTLNDATDFLIENTSKGYIDYIRNFKDMEDYAMKMYLTKSFEDINKLFFKHDLYKPNQCITTVTNQYFIIFQNLKTI